MIGQCEIIITLQNNVIRAGLFTQYKVFTVFVYIKIIFNIVIYLVLNKIRKLRLVHRNIS
ncbi:Uncharacterised protein [Vibrio cholerae]|nr:Uncharacterised protein [Vibrio cholerae]